MVRLGRRQEPDPAVARIYAAKRRRYRAALEALGPHWAALRWQVE